MADDANKQEAPSAQRIRKAREEGNVAKSQEVVAFISLVIGVFVIFGMFPFWLDNFHKIYISCLDFFKTDFSVNNIFSLLLVFLFRITLMLLPVLIALFVAGILGNIMQFGFLLTSKVLKPNLSKLNPINGLKNIFSLKRLLDGLVITLKVFVAFCLGAALILIFLKQIAGVAMLEVFSQMIWVRNKALILIAALLILFFIVAVSDFLIKRYQYIKSLRMSKQEVKDEYKQQEGNPEIKAKIRQIMMKNTMSKMMAAIPSANVVVTNPTHYAVALRFADNDPAPVVVAKGIDHLALRIKGIAREHHIEIIENKSLARQLYRQVDLQEPIPRELFEAVAIVFAQVKAIQDQHRR